VSFDAEVMTDEVDPPDHDVRVGSIKVYVVPR
jgi:hypothetical protein